MTRVVSGRNASTTREHRPMEPHESRRAAGPRARCVRWKAARNMHCTHDTFHTTCTDTCDMWTDPASAACVCLRSHAVHLCGKDCTIPPRRLESGEGYVCPLSGIVVEGADAVATPVFDKVGRCINHWSGSQRIRPRVKKVTQQRNRKPLTEETCAKIMHDVLCGAVKRNAQSVLSTRAVKRVTKATKQLHAAGIVDFRMISAVVHAARRSIGQRAAKGEAEQHVRDVARAVCAYMRAHPRCMMATNDVVVCTWLTLLSTGMSKGQTVVVSQHPFVAQHIPPPSLMALVPKVQCRAISVAVRRFKEYAFTARGDVVHARVFRGIESTGTRSRQRARQALCSALPSRLGPTHG